jgi:hypothetical protein
MLLRLNEVYANDMERAEERLLKGIKAKFRRTTCCRLSARGAASLRRCPE